MQMKPLNDTVLIKMKRKSSEIITSSGIIIRGVEQDFHVAEVVAKGPGKWQENKSTGKDEFITVDCEVGDVIVIEKNFYHEYDATTRNRVENTIDIPKMDDEFFTYHLTKDKDVYLKFDNWEEADSFKVYGELYSIMQPKPLKKSHYRP